MVFGLILCQSKKKINKEITKKRTKKNMKEWGSFDPGGNQSFDSEKRLPSILKMATFDLEIVGVFDPGGMGDLRPWRR